MTEEIAFNVPGSYVWTPPRGWSRIRVETINPDGTRSFLAEFERKSQDVKKSDGQPSILIAQGGQGGMVVSGNPGSAGGSRGGMTVPAPAPSRPAHAWVLYDHDRGPYAIALYDDLEQAAREASRRGYGKVARWPFGMELAEAIKEWEGR